MGGNLCKCVPCREGRDTGGQAVTVAESSTPEEVLVVAAAPPATFSEPPIVLSVSASGAGQLHDIEEIEENGDDRDDTSSNSTLFSKNSSRKDHRGSGGSTRQLQSSPSPTFSISNINLIKGRRKKNRCVREGESQGCQVGLTTDVLLTSPEYVEDALR